MLLAIAGDIHGALDALYARVAAWEERRSREAALVLQSGDFGALADPSRADAQTRKHAREDPTELGAVPYLTGERTAPRPTWFVRGNHEDFDLLAARGEEPLDLAGRIRQLAGGRIHVTTGGEVRIAALGGIQPRKVKEPGLPRYVQPEEAAALLALEPGSADVLLAHDGPIGRSLAGVASAGSVAVYDAVKRLRPRFLFFGHYDRPPPPFELHGCRCVPLNQPGPARLPGRDGGVGRLDTADWSFAWIDPDGSERPL